MTDDADDVESVEKAAQKLGDFCDSWADDQTSGATWDSESAASYLAKRDACIRAAAIRESEERDEWPGLAPGRGSIGDIVPDWWCDDDEVSSITLDGELVDA